MVEKLKRLLRASLLLLSSDAFLSIFPIAVVVQNIIFFKQNFWESVKRCSRQLLSHFFQSFFSPVSKLNIKTSIKAHIYVKYLVSLRSNQLLKSRYLYLLLNWTFSLFLVKEKNKVVLPRLFCCYDGQIQLQCGQLYFII